MHLLKLLNGFLYDCLVGLPSQYSTGPLGPTQPGHPSVDRCDEHWRSFQPPLGKKRRVLRSSVPYYKGWW